MPQDSVDIAIITVLPEEYAAVHRLLRQPAYESGTGQAPNLYGWETGWIDRADGSGAYRVGLAMRAAGAGWTCRRPARR